MAKETFYVYKRDDGTIGRIAKFVDNKPYGYENGEWVFMPTLYKIRNDVTNDYEEISKEEADRLTNA